MFMAICRQVIFFSLVFATFDALATSKDLSAARDLYKKGQYAKAAAIYQAIDRDAPDFLRTREELAWSYLRAGDWSQLRGVLAHLNTDLVPLRWRLEGRVMSAMLHLRECQYEKVTKELTLFQTEMAPLVRAVVEQADNSSHKGYWRALKEEVAEALLKMKFVKLELRSRLVMLNREQVVDGQSTQGLNDKIPVAMQTFPLNDDLWVDEIFHARGTGTGACEEIHKAKVIR